MVRLEHGKQLAFDPGDFVVRTYRKHLILWWTGPALVMLVAAACSGGGTDPTGPDSEDVIPPVATISEPSSQASVRDTITVRVDATDNDAVGSVTLLVDGQATLTLNAAPFEFRWNSLSSPNGVRELRAEAVDASGNRSLSTPVSVLVDNDGWIQVRLDGASGFGGLFGIRFDNDPPRETPIGTALTSDPLRPGSHLVQLPERYTTCAPRGDRIRQIDVVGGDTTDVLFDIGCFVGRAYVSNNLQGTLSILDSSAPASVGESFAIGGALRCIAGLRSRRKAWIASITSNRIQVLSTSTDQSLGIISVPAPRCVAAHEGAGVVLATTTATDQVVFIDPDTDAIVAELAVPASPHRIAFDADGRFAYVAHTTVPGRVTVIDVERRSIDRVLEVGSNPFGILYDSIGDRLIVSNTGGTTVLAVDPSDGTVLAETGTGVAPIGLAISSDGEFMYVANSGSNTISLLDRDLESLGSIGVGRSPQELAITSDGHFLLSTNQESDDVSLVDLRNREEIRRIPVGDGPNGLLLHGGW